MPRFVAFIGLVLVLAGFAAVAAVHPEPAALGFDEISYAQLHSQVIQAGQAISQHVRVEAPGLSKIAFLYSYTGEGPAPVDVTVRSGGTLLGHDQPKLRPTLALEDREAWWSYQTTGDAAPDTWQTLARFQEVPIRGPSAGTVTVTIAVPVTGRPVLLYWSPADTSRRYAIRTEYGPAQPALLKAPTYVSRVARFGSPWLPAPAACLLAATLIGLLGIVSWRMAGAPRAEALAQPSRRELD
jgi:hypothetical protein